MPWRLIIRFVWIALALIGGREALRKQMPGRDSGRFGARFEAAVRAHPRLRRVGHRRELIGLALRTVGITVGAGFAVLAAIGAATLRSSGPSWLVVGFLAVAVIAAIETGIEVFRARAAVQELRRPDPDLVIANE